MLSGPSRSTFARLGARRPWLFLFSAWSLAWILGIGVLASVSINLNGALQRQGLDSQLKLYATAVYGTTWFDAQGRFHRELLDREQDLLDGDVNVWLIEPVEPPIVHLAPSTPRIDMQELVELSREILATQEDILRDGSDALNGSSRLHAIPTYADDVDDKAKAAIIVVADPSGSLNSQDSFITRVMLLSIVLGLMGVTIGGFLARWSLRPIAQALEQRERFVSAAAHELRTPMATLQAICDSAVAGDEPPERALARVAPLVGRTAKVVDELLLFARLDAGQTVLERQRIRLDLLVEACLGEDEACEFTGEACLVEADPRLLRVAVRNLLENASRHAAGRAVVDAEISKREGIRVSVGEGSITVEDHGPGFPKIILDLGKESFSMAPSQHGAGIGLATVQLIARLHGGTLELSNRPEGGARAVIRILSEL